MRFKRKRTSFFRSILLPNFPNRKKKSVPKKKCAVQKKLYHEFWECRGMLTAKMISVRKFSCMGGKLTFNTGTSKSVSLSSENVYCKSFPSSLCSNSKYMDTHKLYNTTQEKPFSEILQFATLWRRFRSAANNSLKIEHFHINYPIFSYISNDLCIIISLPQPLT